MRLLAEIIPKFGKDRIREWLKTSDLKAAIRKAEALAKRHAGGIKGVSQRQ